MMDSLGPSGLTPEQKRAQRFEKWLSAPQVVFRDNDARDACRERVTRFIKAIRLEAPDRVPVLLPVDFFPAYYGGADLKTVMYDYAELSRTWLHFIEDFELGALRFSLRLAARDQRHHAGYV